MAAALVTPLLVAAGSPAAGDEPTPPPTTEAPTGPATLAYRFLSTPDFLNGDVGDVRSSRFYRAGQPNSINDDYRRALTTVLDAFAAEEPGDVLVAGDLVEGHWGLDGFRTGTFGPVRTEAEKVAAVRRAGRLYFRQWRARFAARGLDVHAAVGDHELGDNPWSTSRGPRAAFKQRNVGVFKETFARHVIAPGGYSRRPAGPAASTAYATRLAPEVLLVTVDVFKRTRTDVVPQLDPQQLAWLDRVLAGARRDGVDWVVVQGHTPVIGPVRQRASSGLMYAGGRRSDFWRTMARHRVDLYLAGEVHAVTAHHVDGITQVSHGGIFTGGQTNYLRGDVRGEQLELTLMDFEGRSGGATGPQLWQTDRHKTPSAVLSYEPGPTAKGHMILHRDNTVVGARTGLLAPYPAD